MKRKIRKEKYENNSTLNLGSKGNEAKDFLLNKTFCKNVEKLRKIKKN